MRISAPSSSVQICRSGLSTSTSPTVWMSPAVTAPGPCFFTTMRLGPSPCILIAMSLMLSTMSVTSSRTPAIEENSCSTPSMCTDCTAAPCSDDSRMRRSALPSVWPKPRSSGSATTVANAGRVGARRYLQLVRSNQFLPIFLDRHCVTSSASRSAVDPGVGDRGSVRGVQIPKQSRAARAARDRYVRRAGACADGSHCAGSSSRRGST